MSMAQPTAPHRVPAGEYGKLRVIALPTDLAKTLAPPDGWQPLFAALGVDYLQAADIQLVDIAALGEMTLGEFLQEAYEIAPEQLAPVAAQLQAQSGYVVLLRSGAFGGRAQQLVLQDGVHLVAFLSEPGPGPLALGPLPAAGAAGHLAGPARPTPSNAAILGRVATVALLVIFALTALMVWVAG